MVVRMLRNCRLPKSLFGTTVLLGAAAGAAFAGAMVFKWFAVGDRYATTYLFAFYLIFFASVVGAAFGATWGIGILVGYWLNYRLHVPASVRWLLPGATSFVTSLLGAGALVAPAVSALLGGWWASATKVSYLVIVIPCAVLASLVSVWLQRRNREAE